MTGAVHESGHFLIIYTWGLAMRIRLRFTPDRQSSNDLQDLSSRFMVPKRINRLFHLALVNQLLFIYHASSRFWLVQFYKARRVTGFG
jgi:hypothetical protein